MCRVLHHQALHDCIHTQSCMHVQKKTNEGHMQRHVWFIYFVCVVWWACCVCICMCVREKQTEKTKNGTQAGMRNVHVLFELVRSYSLCSQRLLQNCQHLYRNELKT